MVNQLLRHRIPAHRPMHLHSRLKVNLKMHLLPKLTTMLNMGTIVPSTGSPSSFGTPIAVHLGNCSFKKHELTALRRAMTLNTSFKSCWDIKIRPTTSLIIGAPFTMYPCATPIQPQFTRCLPILRRYHLSLHHHLRQLSLLVTWPLACGPNNLVMVAPSTLRMSRMKRHGRLLS